MIKINTAKPEISPFFLPRSLGTYSTHDATWPLSDIEGGSLPVYMQHPLEPQRALYYLFHICCTPQYLYTLRCGKLVELPFNVHFQIELGNK